MHRIHCQPLQLIFSDKLYPCPPAGVALGLAWTSMGGSTLYIETLGQVRQKLLPHRLTLPLSESQRGWDRWRCRTDRKSWWCDEGEHKDRRHLCQVAKDTKDGLDTRLDSCYALQLLSYLCAEPSWRRGNLRTLSLRTRGSTYTCLRAQHQR